MVNVSLPKKVKRLWSTDKRYVVLYGGRGSAKSWSIATFLVIQSINKKSRILCVREVQSSIKDSVHKLLCDTIERYNLEEYFVIQRDSIKSVTGSEFFFKGLWNNSNDIKSTEGIDYCWIEEAHAVSKVSLDTLFPTVRKKDSQIIISYNPTNDDDPIHASLTIPAQKKEREDVELIPINYSGNPHFPDVLREEMEWDKKVDYDKYLHKWEGQCIAHSEAQIFHGKWGIKDFELPYGAKFFYGADWGFGDPLAVSRLAVKDNILYVCEEAYGVKVEITDYPSFFDSIPDIRKNKIIADSSRPESISFMQGKGFFIIPSKKGKGSVEDGITRLKGFEKIIVHPRCKHSIEELRFYCYKVDKRTGIISTIPEDKNNHLIDSWRYATENYHPGSIARVRVL